MTLEVSGDVNISGSLWVDDNNMTVPDYVLTFFKKEIEGKETNKSTQGYELLTLPQLKEYIVENERLPPSRIQGQFALDGESNNLVQQQYYLMEKLEEQALYIIQLEARLQALETHTSLSKENRVQEKS